MTHVLIESIQNLTDKKKIKPKKKLYDQKLSKYNKVIISTLAFLESGWSSRIPGWTFISRIRFTKSGLRSGETWSPNCIL